MAVCLLLPVWCTPSANFIVLHCFHYLSNLHSAVGDRGWGSFAPSSLINTWIIYILNTYIKAVLLMIIYFSVLILNLDICPYILKTSVRLKNYKRAFLKLNKSEGPVQENQAKDSLNDSIHSSLHNIWHLPPSWQIASSCITAPCPSLSSLSASCFRCIARATTEAGTGPSSFQICILFSFDSICI